ncbi:cytochrome c3 family protein [Thermodesulfobacteriota bacterium]
MKYFTITTLIGISLCFSFPGHAEVDTGPEVINMKEHYAIQGRKKPVLFQHRKHQQSLDCTSCHVEGDGSGKLKIDITQLTTISNDFHRKVCWPCHKKMSVSIGKTCNACHQ